MTSWADGRLLAGVLAAGLVAAGDPLDDEEDGRRGPGGQDAAVYEPDVEPASDEGRAAMDTFELADGLVVGLFAAEPMLANPVCLALDEQGVVYVGETHRHYAGVGDIRDHTDWLEEDFACETVEDRLAMLQRNLGDEFLSFDVEHERIRRLVDTDGDGQADEVDTFADGFNQPAAGIGAGLLARDGHLYYTCIPELWRLADADGDGVADEREVLSEGYGVRIGFLGHDLHGLELGHDGRLYFSNGDRGLSVETGDGRLHLPDEGCVLRCELDGSGLEVVHTGLRNPQELAFDDWGDLFTGDNNADMYDVARFVRIVEGGDSGWRGPFQWVDGGGAWTGEKLWSTEGPAAFRLPPVGNLANGPSGLAHFEGTGLDPEVYRDHFFLCDFLGTRRGSGVLAFDVVRAGASFELGEIDKVVWGFLATDVETGPDGALYVTDWVRAWAKTGKGRVYKVSDPERAGDAVVVETARMLAGGFAGRSVDELVGLLAWPDRRVRLEAQLALCDRGAQGLGALASASRPVAVDVPDSSAAARQALLSRVHATWGLGVVARRHADLSTEAISVLVERAADAAVEVRGQAVAMLGDLRARLGADVVLERLADESPRVRYFAALAAGRLALPGAVEPLVEIVRAAGAADPDLRHAAVMGLVGACADEALLELMSSDDEHVRMAAVLVLRRRADPRLSRFLYDDVPAIVHEAARAIHDVPVPDALPALASVLIDDGVRARLASVETDTAAGQDDEADETDDDERADTWVWRRAINANLRVGEPDNASLLAEYALDEEADVELRAEAVAVLRAWAEPPGLDRLTGFWWPLPEREVGFLQGVATDLLAGGIGEAPDAVAAEWVRLVEFVADGTGRQAELAAVVEPELVRLLEGDRGADLRVAALAALGALEVRDLHDHVGVALVADDAELRAAALEALADLDPGLALPRLPALLETGELPERRVALQILGRLDDPAAEGLLAWQLEHLLADTLPDELALDLVEAAEAHESVRLTELLARHRAPRRADPTLGPWLDALLGGDGERGREVYERTETQCVRCHEPPDDDDLDVPLVGPDLSGVGERLGRLQLLESVLAPNRRVAPGFGTENLFLAGGRVVSGRVLDDGAEGIVRVQTAEGDVLGVPVADIEARRPALSAMPENLAAALTRQEMRDLIEYLDSK